MSEKKLEIEVRELAEKFFEEEISKIDDPQRKEEVELEKETYIGVWILGYRAGESPAEQPVVDELEHLRRWKMEAAELLTKINSYAHKHLEMKLGECAVEFVIDRCKELDRIKAPEQPVREVEANMFKFTEWCHENAVAQYENKRFHSWRLFGPNADDKDYTTAQLYQLFKKQKEK